MEQVYSNKIDCYGCEACANICPKSAINMVQDEQGFRYPKIDLTKCIDCGMCKKVCPIGKEQKFIKKPVKECYAIKNDDSVRRVSSSGGFYTLLSDYILNNNFECNVKEKGVCVGAIYDDNLKVIHKMAYSVDERNLFRGSKYVQSNILNTFIEIGDELNKENEVLFTGTPCQVVGLLSYLESKHINTERLITNDLVCHGAPSPKIWEDCILFLEKKYKSKIVDFKFRNKSVGWRGYNIQVTFADGLQLNNTADSKIFTTLFSNDLILRPSCYYCPYATLGRCADITIGDFWGIENILPEFSDNKGVSMVFFNSSKGEKIWEKLSNKISYKRCLMKNKLQHNLYSPTNHTDRYDIFWRDYQNKKFSVIACKYGEYGSLSKFYIILNKIKNRIKSKLK